MQKKHSKNHPELHTFLRGHGYRVTTGRKAILTVLSDIDIHLSADDIYQKIHKRYPYIGFTTIYRTLELLERMGIVSKLDFGDGRARYEIADGLTKKPHHHHLVCLHCRRVIDYTDFIKEELEFLKRAEKGLTEKYNFAIESHVIQFYGACEQCFQRNEKHKE